MPPWAFLGYTLLAGYATYILVQIFFGIVLYMQHCSPLAVFRPVAVF